MSFRTRRPPEASRPTLTPTVTISLVSDAEAPCGVDAFARRAADALAEASPASHRHFRLTGQPGERALLARELATADALIVNLPIVAWKRRILAPLAAMATARRLGREVILVLHEWADLDWKRRTTYLAYLPLATRLMFSSPHVRAGFEADRALPGVTRIRGLVPIPPNLIRPAEVPPTALSRAFDEQRRAGRFVLGQFGSLYPKKPSGDLFEIAAHLRAAGQSVHLAFIGSFVRGGTVDPAEAFWQKARTHGFERDVTVSGYIGPDAEVFAALEACDAFLYRFDEGLTSRRGSVLACLQAGRPVLVDAPRDPAEFDHHATYRQALDSGQLILLPNGTTPAAIAARLAAARTWRSPSTLDAAATWRAAARSLIA